MGFYMKGGTRKFLFSVLVLLMAFSVVAAPFFGVEKVSAQEGGFLDNFDSSANEGKCYWRCCGVEREDILY